MERTPSTPTRRATAARALKQQTLAMAMANAVTSAPVAASVPVTPPPVPAVSVSVVAPLALAEPRTPTRSTPRRTAQPNKPVVEPYEQCTYDQLRQECQRRRVSYRGPNQTKRRFISALREYDLLLMYEKKAEKKEGPDASPKAASLVVMEEASVVRPETTLRRGRSKSATPPVRRQNTVNSKPRPTSAPTSAQVATAVRDSVAQASTAGNRDTPSAPSSASTDPEPRTVVPIVEPTLDVVAAAEERPVLGETAVDTVAANDLSPPSATPPTPSSTQARVSTMNPGKPKGVASRKKTINRPAGKKAAVIPGARATKSVATRARRGCRFRLINVLISPEFEARWSEMHAPLSTPDESVNAFWRDVHIAFFNDSILNDMHRQDIEADLRFYLGIKKRLQEQIMMLMQGF
ncbi:hypothetical protein P43SY_000915 [Pythium insidiosum]|uniref:Uncharacterized protein n=1 Tax=Pythium insidiosum TaxID=114742 RepID=A0AAD5LJW3_PYTIN|nr:hypothetical protein P43SY_000915 [Pythium insidiosum]